jgi:Cdc6-like AAA superfamily ATPase
MARVRHGFKDFFGASEAKFRAKLDNIALLKKKIVDDSQAIFQDKSLQQLESVKGIVSNIEGAVNQVRDFQATLTRMHEEQTEQWQLVLKKMEEIKATTKPITAWDQALLVFEKNKEALSPQKDTSDALSDAIDKRHPGTSQWIFDQQLYNDWKDPTSNKLLCLSGEQGSGKSVVLATVIEQLGDGDVENSTLLYFSCGSTKRGTPSKGVLSVDNVCHTLLYQLYSLAREDENNVKLLEDCNKVFANPKAKKIGKVISQSNNDEKLPDFVDAFLAIAKYLKLCVIVALDEVDCLTPSDQQELCDRLRSIVDPSETVDMEESPIKVLVGCRSGTEFTARMPSAEVDVGYYNKGT